MPEKMIIWYSVLAEKNNMSRDRDITEQMNEASFSAYFMSFAQKPRK